MNDDSAIEILPALPAVESWRDSCMPATIEVHGPAARFAWEEFFRGEIRNEYTRRNYAARGAAVPGMGPTRATSN